MPTYEYECVVCGIKYEVEQPMDKVTTPLCCAQSMKQIYSAPGLSFKGNGWGKDA
jgi:putative FmdB family regulatory protein